MLHLGVCSDQEAYDASGSSVGVRFLVTLGTLCLPTPSENFGLILIRSS